jgi:hypothetical protein
MHELVTFILGWLCGGGVVAATFLAFHMEQKDQKAADAQRIEISPYVVDLTTYGAGMRPDWASMDAWGRYDTPRRD